MGLFSDTDEFFRRRRVNPSHVGPVVIVGSIAVIGVLRNLLIDIAIVQQMTGE